MIDEMVELDDLKEKKSQTRAARSSTEALNQLIMHAQVLLHIMFDQSILQLVIEKQQMLIGMN